MTRRDAVALEKTSRSDVVGECDLEDLQVVDDIRANWNMDACEVTGSRWLCEEAVKARARAITLEVVVLVARAQRNRPDHRVFRRVFSSN